MFFFISVLHKSNGRVHMVTLNGSGPNLAFLQFLYSYGFMPKAFQYCNVPKIKRAFIFKDFFKLHINWSSETGFHVPFTHGKSFFVLPVSETRATNWVYGYFICIMVSRTMGLIKPYGMNNMTFLRYKKRTDVMCITIDSFQHSLNEKMNS